MVIRLYMKNTFRFAVPRLVRDASGEPRGERQEAVQAFGSNWPVFTNEPLKAIYCAVTRMTPAGTPVGGWYLKVLLTVMGGRDTYRAAQNR